MLFSWFFPLNFSSLRFLEGFCSLNMLATYSKLNYNFIWPIPAVFKKSDVVRTDLIYVLFPLVFSLFYCILLQHNIMVARARTVAQHQYSVILLHAGHVGVHAHLR